MASNFKINDAILAEALRLGGHKTKRETVDAALEEYVSRRQQLGIIELFGQIDFDPDYDYKAQRQRS